jgi:hypothetical protein
MKPSDAALLSQQKEASCLGCAVPLFLACKWQAYGAAQGCSLFCSLLNIFDLDVKHVNPFHLCLTLASLLQAINDYTRALQEGLKMVNM